MIGVGLVFLVIGAISEWVVDNHVMVGNQNLDMDAIGLIFLFVGGLGVLIGLAYMAMATNTTHVEEVHKDVLKRDYIDEDVHHDVVVDKVPGEEPKKIVRRSRKKY